MQISRYPQPDELEVILKRPVTDIKKIEKIVEPILKKVMRKGDKALRKFNLEYDHVEIEDLLVTEEEFQEAERLLTPALKGAINVAKNNIEKFHAAQKDHDIEVETFPGVICSRKVVPIQKVGLYVPGGTAPLFSTVLMLGIPAKLAGCKEIVICTPANHAGKINPAILYSASILGIYKIVKVGGAQAIAAMAFGTETVPQVDKIFGPGNQYVTAAKQLVSRLGIGIDMPAGPSEVMVYADETSIPSFVASDLLSQAEHGVDSQVMFVTNREDLIDQVNQELEKQLETLPRKEIAVKSLENSYAVLVNDENEAIKIINQYGPEHLILAVKNANEVADAVVNAGSVFIGNFTPESAGDYASGTNHTLPTNGYAKSYSGVSLDSFMKKITFQKISEKGLLELGPVIEAMATAEHLIAHKEAVTIRLNYINGKF
jgi:histidinol dehydrogenase